MENSNVNNLNGVPNFGHGFEDEKEIQGSSESENSDARIQEGNAPFGEQAGSEGEEQEASDSDSTETSGVE